MPSQTPSIHKIASQKRNFVARQTEFAEMSGTLGLTRVSSALKSMACRPIVKVLPKARRVVFNPEQTNADFIANIHCFEVDRASLRQVINFAGKFLELDRDTIETDKCSEILQYLIQIPSGSLDLSYRECLVFLLLLKRTNTISDYREITISLAEKLSSSKDPESICRCIGFLRKNFPRISETLMAKLSPSDYTDITAEAVVHVMSANPPIPHIPALADRWLKTVDLRTKPKLVICGTASFSRYSEAPEAVFDFLWKFLKSRSPLTHQDRLGAAEIFRRRRCPADVARIFAEAPDLARTSNPGEFFRVLSAVSLNLEISTLEKVVGAHFKSFQRLYKPEHIEIASELLKKPKKTKSEIL